MATTKKRTVVAASAATQAPAKRARTRVVVEAGETAEEARGKALSYFASTTKPGIDLVPSGAVLLDCVGGGGYPLGRIVNIVGDKSAGKTLLAIEAVANFVAMYPEGKVRYFEAEAAFDEQYAAALGMPVDVVDFGKPGTHGRTERAKQRTIEDWYNEMDRFLAARAKDGLPAIFVVDSFDSLSDDAEMLRDINEGTYGQGKAKKSGELFRKMVDRIEDSRVLLIIISQLRDKINAMTFGEKQTRSGGRALDFYASQIYWLAEIGKIKKVIDKVERVIGVNVKARNKKNKVGLPYRECEYPILFGYGIDDITASVEWLIEVGCEDKLKEAVGMSKAGYKVRIQNLRDKGGAPLVEVRKQLNALVRKEWERIESGFLPKSRKYG